MDETRTQSIAHLFLLAPSVVQSLIPQPDVSVKMDQLALRGQKEKADM